MDIGVAVGGGLLRRVIVLLLRLLLLLIRSLIKVSLGSSIASSVSVCLLLLLLLHAAGLRCGRGREDGLGKCRGRRGKGAVVWHGQPLVAKVEVQALIVGVHLCEQRLSSRVKGHAMERVRFVTNVKLETRGERPGGARWLTSWRLGAAAQSLMGRYVRTRSSP